MAKTKKTNNKKKAKSKAKAKKQPSVKMVTYSPGLTASQVLVLKLTKDVVRNVNGIQEKVKEPLFDFLPEKIIVKRDESVELTIEQYNALRKEGYIETKAERKERLAAIADIPKQSGVDPQLIQSSKVNRIYRDVLVDFEEE